MRRGLWLALAVVIVAAVFAYEGGTFSEPAYRALKRELVAAKSQERVLKRAVDSLRAFRDSLATNPAVQERVAREAWSVTRPGELVIQIVADSGAGQKPE